MRPFTYERVRDPAAAAQAAGARAEPVSYLAGGTTLVDLMKLDVMQPQRLIDINALHDSDHGRIELGQHGLRLGALVRMADAADHPEIARRYPMIAQSLQFAASPQL